MSTLVKVVINAGYVCENTEATTDHAKQALYEDICNAVKHDTIQEWIEVVSAPEASKCDIPNFLIETGGEV